MGHWVESFQALASKHDGQLLRCVSLLQHADRVMVAGFEGARAIGSPNNIYPDHFDFLQHLGGNYSPNNTLAFPRGVFHELGIRFDESLSTTEDWDYILRVASVVGVASSKEVTGIYLWWERSNSRAEHSDHEWDANKAWIHNKLSSHPMLLPKGTVRRVLDMQEKLQQLTNKLAEVEHYNSILIGHASHLSQELRNKAPEDQTERLRALTRVYSLLNSTSWKISAPVRFALRLLTGKHALRFEDCIFADLEMLNAHERALKSSTSWHLTKPIRAVARTFR